MARTSRGVAWRLALTVVAVYTLFFTPRVSRETFLATALAERATARVDPYLGLHPDIVETPGRGVYIIGNPGASMMAAVPYAAVRPVLERVYAAFPTLVTPRLPVAYDDGRQGRAQLVNETRARGLDVRLGIAAIVMHLGVTVPLAVVGVVLVYFFLLDRIGRPRDAQWFALLYAFGTPMLFGSAYLNRHVLVAHALCFAFLALAWRRGDGPTATPPSEAWRPALAGFFLGFALLCDEAALPLVLVAAVWTCVTRAQRTGAAAAVQAAATLAAGAAWPLGALLAYQAAATGHPFTPVVASPGVMQLPIASLLWRNLFDPAFGLFVLSPWLGLALAAPWRASKRAMIRRDELWLLLSASAVLYLSRSATAPVDAQASTGVGELMPSVPLLFLATLPVLRGANKRLAWTLVTLSVVIGWVVAMTREPVPDGFVRLVRHGFDLPWMTVLSRAGGAYLPDLPRRGGPTLLYAVLAVGLWRLWKKRSGE